MNSRTSFFCDEAADRDLAIANRSLWDVLIGIIESDRSTAPCSTLLDVGCHSGEFLDHALSRWHPQKVYGIEPIENLRQQAARLLKKHSSCYVNMGGTEDWSAIPSRSIDLITCQEVLYLVPDLPGLFGEFRRVLASNGCVYVTLGSHVENPLWPQWRDIMVEQGIVVFDYKPMDIMVLAERFGFWPAIRPLRTSGWISYAPSEARFPVNDIKSLFNYHFRHKILFRFEA